MNATCKLVETKSGSTRPVYTLEGVTIERLGAKQFYANDQRYVSLIGAVAGTLCRVQNRKVSIDSVEVHEAVTALYAAEKALMPPSKKAQKKAEYKAKKEAEK